MPHKRPSFRVLLMATTSTHALWSDLAAPPASNLSPPLATVACDPSAISQ
jgi:hypothetical protein